MKGNLLKKKKILLNMYNLIMEDNIYHDYMEMMSKELLGLNTKLYKTKEEGDLELYEYLKGYYRELTETICGSCFIMCQTKISALVSDVMKFKNLLPSGEISNFQEKYFKFRKSEIMDFGKDRLNKGLSYASVTNAYANYFKHKDEWNEDWQINVGPAKDSSDILLGFGANPQSSTILKME